LKKVHTEDTENTEENKHRGVSAPSFRDGAIRF